MAGPYTFIVKRVALRYPSGVQATEETAPTQTAVELDNDPANTAVLPGSLISLAVVGDARADFPEGAKVEVSFGAPVMPTTAAVGSKAMEDHGGRSQPEHHRR